MSDVAHPSPTVRVDPAGAPATARAAEHDLLALADQLCFALYSTSRAMTAAYRPFLDAVEVTYPQYIALLALWERPGMTMKELGEQLRLDYGTVSPLIQRLQSRGLVESIRCTHDRRSVELRSTEAGDALQREAKSMIVSVLGEVGYPVAAVIELRDQVNALGERLEAVLSERQSGCGAGQLS